MKGIVFRFQRSSPLSFYEKNHSYWLKLHKGYIFRKNIIWDKETILNKNIDIAWLMTFVSF